MNYVSICSGIEAATAAWHPLGWSPLAFSEIEPFPSAVLAHHHPDVPNLGDMTKYEEWKFCRCDPARSVQPTGGEREQLGIRSNANRRPLADVEHVDQPRSREHTKNQNCETCGNPIIDVLVGGTPCQSFSVAGLRKGLADPRGNLTLTFLAMVDRFRPAWVVWENVPGVLSDKSNAFGIFLAGLGELGYGFAYRVLDAQHFGVPQRRRRVFVVASIGGVHPGQVLFEPESLCRDLTPRRDEGKGVAGVSIHGAAIGREPENGPQHGDFIDDGTSHTLTKTDVPGVHVGHEKGIPVAFEPRFARNGRGMPDTVVPPLKAENGTTGKGDGAPCVANQVQVRRLTPVECERLQGFPDDHTRIPWRGKPADQCPDGPRYKALGNSMAVPVMAWIGERIAKQSGA